MNKRILVSQEEKNSILSMHESFKNRGVIKEDEMADMSAKKCTVKVTKKFTVRTLDTGATVNGKNITKGMTLNPGDTVSLISGKSIYSTVTGDDAPTAAGCYDVLTCKGISQSCGD